MQEETIARNWRQLIRPRRLDCEQEEVNPTYGRFSCEPLERGFGQTLGNSLRRVLLSSLQGASITSVKITGVLHEFSTIPGVIEDVSDIVPEPEGGAAPHARRSAAEDRADLHRKGEGESLAGDLVERRLDRGGHESGAQASPAPLGRTLPKVEMELTIGMGKGYVPGREEQGPRTMPDRDDPDRLDLLARHPKVNYHGDAGPRRSRDGLRPLNLEIWTDGDRGSGGRAWRYAAKILKEQLQHLHQLRRAGRGAASGSSDEPTPLNPNLFRRWTSWSSRCARQTASRTPTSVTSASWFRRPRPRCSRPRTSDGSPSTRSRKFSPRWTWSWG